MSDTDHPPILIIKRSAIHEEEHHGGAWKIAFADFMTAMMALFLVLWLISSTSEKTKQTVAQYFNPVQLVDMTPQKKGFMDPTDAETVSQGRSEPLEEEGKATGASAKARSMRPDAEKAVVLEAGLFKDPLATLTEIAERDDGTYGEPMPRQGGHAPEKPVEVFEDPFSTVLRRNESVGRDPRPQPDAKAMSRAVTVSAAISDKAVGDAERQQAPPQKPQDVARGRRKQATASESAFNQLKAELVAAGQIESNAKAGPKVDVRSTDEGLLVSLTDDDNYSMFSIGSAEPTKSTVEVMARIGKLLQTRDGTLVVRGHTDGRPYRSSTYDNWRLSAARAHMAHYMLVRGGIDENRIEKIEGHADRSLRNKADPNAAENRRIEILLREKKS